MPGAGGLSIANYCAAWRRCIAVPVPVLTERLLSGEPLRPSGAWNHQCAIPDAVTAQGQRDSQCRVGVCWFSSGPRPHPGRSGIAGIDGP